jgi:hypothetical protein
MTVGPTSLFGLAFALLIPLVLFVAIAAIIIAVLYFRHRERMAYLAGGHPYPPPPGQPQRPPYAPPAAQRYPYPTVAPPHPLATALNTAGIGLGITLGFLTLGFGPWLLPGAITLGYGVGQLGAYALEPHLGPRTPPTGL